MKKLLLLSVLLFGFASIAQIVTIPDANFKTALLNHDPVIDTNSDGEIQVSEAEATISVHVRDASISDLTGIEAFTNLEELYCIENLISSIDLSSNIELLYLVLSSNQVTSLNLSTNTKLLRLDIGENQLSSIDLSANSLLESFNGFGNPLTFLDFGNNPSLSVVVVGETLLETIDFSQNVNLNYLWCEYSGLTELDLTANMELIRVNLNGNLLTSLDLSNKPNLVTVNCSFQQLETLILNDSPNIETLIAEDNQLTELDVTGKPNLKFLEVGMNNLTELDLTDNILLERLSCHTNALTSLDVSQNVQLSEFWSYNNESLSSIDIKNGANDLMLSFVSFNNAENMCIQVDDEIAANAGTGVYQDWVTDPTVIFAEDCQLGVGEFLDSSILLFPNPTSNILNIQSELVINSIEIINVLGQSLISIGETGNKKQLDVSRLSTGNYFVVINSVDSSAVYQIIKE